LASPPPQKISHYWCSTVSHLLINSQVRFM
jgi:hypothetical protein